VHLPPWKALRVDVGAACMLHVACCMSHVGGQAARAYVSPSHAANAGPQLIDSLCKGPRSSSYSLLQLQRNILITQ
jgi:hypothetical protein